MKITKSYLKQVIKEELQKEIFGFGKKKQDSSSPVQNVISNDKELTRLIDQLDAAHNAGMSGMGDRNFDPDAPGLDKALIKQLVAKLKQKNISDDRIYAFLKTQYGIDYGYKPHVERPKTPQELSDPKYRDDDTMPRGM